MLSLENIFSKDKLKNYYNNLFNKNNINKINLFCDLKIDGVAINLLYNNGYLIKASTRGNGLFGEDITNNIKLIRDIPKCLKINNLPYKIPHILEIRGEIFIKKKNFILINNNINLNKKKKFSNPRNLASGSIRNDNMHIKKYLNFYAYNIYLLNNNLKLKNYFLNTQLQKIKLLKKLNFPISKYYRLCNNIEEIYKYYQIINNIRNKLEYDIDGIVLKVNSLQHQFILGNNIKYPKWAIAYKFTSLTKISYIKTINYQISRIGQLIPIANIIPININGVIIKKINLYNFKEIVKLKLHYKDAVFIKRIGDVIPKIIKRIPLLSNNIESIVMPKVCPYCNNKLLINNINYNLQCIQGLKCKGQLKLLIIHFVSRNAFNIKLIGNKIISKLIKHHFIKNPYDIFILNNKKLTKIGISKKVTNKILESIKISKNIYLSNFIYALSIPKVGFLISKKLSFSLNNIHKILKINLNTLKLIKLGNIITTNIYNYFNNLRNIKYIKLLITKINILYG